MTREEAISDWTFRSNHIKQWLDEYGEEPSIRHYVELIDMAIEALTDRPTGEWVKVMDEETPNVTKWHYECDQCGAGRFENGQRYCSRCGARMSDLISRQDAIKPFCIAPDGTRIPEVDCDNFPVEFSVEFIKKHLLSLPSAEPKTMDKTNANKIYNYLKERIDDIVDDMKEFDAWFERMVWHVKECNRLTAEPKTGKWVDDGCIEKCSQCGERREFPHWNYCPNCGADMRGETE